MTDLLRPVSSRPAAPGLPVGRPLALGALVAGLGAPAVALSLLWFVGLIGWYADNGGSNGTTTSVLRVGADAWLLAHGSPLAVRDAVITASPLGLTLVCAYLTYRLARRAGAACDVDSLRSVGAGAVVLAGSYAAVGMLTAVLAGERGAQPGMGLAFLGGALIGGLFGGAGLVRGSGRARELRRLLPIPALSIGYAAAVTALSMVAVGALLTVVGLVFHWSAAVEVTDSLDLDLTGAALSLLLAAGIAPNAALLASTYPLGSGFGFGAGTIVSPGEVTLGPVPSVPILAALPDDGWAPGWVMGLLAVPVLVAAVAAFAVARRLPTTSYQKAAGRGLGSGLVAALALTIAASWAGGAIGPGRMADIGVVFGETLLAAVVPFAVGAVLGALVATWWNRRHDAVDAAHPEPLAEPPTVRPLAGPADITEPVHLPPVSESDLDRLVPQPRGPSPAVLATEETVQLRLGGGDRKDSKAPEAR